MATMVTLRYRGSLHHKFTRINFPSSSVIPQIPEFPSIQKSSNGQADFEAQIREIDKALEMQVSNKGQTRTSISNFFPPLLNKIDSNSTVATTHSNVTTPVGPVHVPKLTGPVLEDNKASSIVVLGPTDVSNQVTNSSGEIVLLAPNKSHVSAKGKKGSNGYKGLALHKKAKANKELVRSDHQGDPKRKLCVIDSSTVDTVDGKKIKLVDVVSLGKVHEDQSRSAKVAKQPCRKQ